MAEEGEKGQNEYKEFTVARVVSENAKVRTLVMGSPLRAGPGQLLMVWLPGIGEKPFAVSGTDPLKLSVANVGQFSSAMHGLKPGEKVWVRGPFGHGYRLKGKRILIVGGGYGASPLRYLAKVASDKGIKVTAVNGARSEAELVKLKERMRNAKSFYCTDDGSCGTKGFVTGLVSELLAKGNYDMVYGCGPEMMLYSLLKLCDESGIDCQLSLERYIKCGTGVCGHCDINGYLVCKDGPVFSKADLLRMGDFGKRRLDASGKSVPL